MEDPRIARAPLAAVSQDDEPEAEVAEPAEPEAPAPPPLSLAGLGIAGLDRRRLAFVLGAFVAIWIVALFARQVGEASAASARAAELAARNAALERDVEARRQELETIQRPEYVRLQARAYRLGGGREIPFRLDPAAPPLPSDAPGSAALRLGAPPERPSPLESWLSLLFGPDD